MLIELQKLSKIFRRGDEEIHALREVTLSIEKGQYVAITGGSGSGKSTLLYILGLLDAATSGSYRFMGQEVSSLSDSELSGLRNRTMGFVFQSFHLLGSIDALKNVAMPLVYAQSHGIGFSRAEIKERAEQALAMVGLSERMYHKPNELSGGQRQRVAIARALVNDPEVIFADEPTGNLDSKTAAGIISLLEELHSQGRTIILVTHDPILAANSPRQIVIKDGMITGDTYVSR